MNFCVKLGVICGLLALLPFSAAAQSEKIVFQSARDLGDFFLAEIYTMNQDGTNPVRLTNNTAFDSEPSFSPDGSKIVFLSNRDTGYAGPAEVYVMNADGSNPVRLTNTPTFVEINPTFSPDGSKILFASTRDSTPDTQNHEIYVMDANGANPTRLTNALPVDIYPRWHPDGTKIIFASERDRSDNKFSLYTMNANGSNVVRLTSGTPNDTGASYNPAGDKIVFMTDRDSPDPNFGTFELYVMNANGTNPVRLTNNAGFYDGEARFNADGTKIAFASDRDDRSQGHEAIFTMDANGANQTRITATGTYDLSPSWVPAPPPAPSPVTFTDVTANEGSGSTTLTFTASIPEARDFAVAFSYRTADGTAYAGSDYTNKFGTVTIPAGQTSATFTVTVLGDAVYEPNEQFTVIFTLNRLVTFARDYATATILNDDSVGTRGGKIVFESNRDGADYEIYSMNADGTGLLQLTNNDYYDAFPSYSPDGKSIVFASTAGGGQFNIYTMNADGSNVKQITTAPAGDFSPRFTPDGKKIIFHSDRDGDFDIFSINVDGTGETELTNTNPATEFFGAISPDGKTIAYRYLVSGTTSVYKMNADGSNSVSLSNSSADSPTGFSPDSGKILIDTFRDGNFEIYRMNADGTNPTRITNDVSADATARYSPDGSKIVFISTRDGGDYQIYVMNADGSAPSRLLVSNGTCLRPDWAPNIAPTVQGAFYYVTRNVPITRAIAATDDTGGALTFSVSTQPTHGTVSISGGNFVYTPATNYLGTDSFTVRASDAQGAVSATATISLNVVAAPGKIVFDSMRDGNMEIYAMNPDGSGLKRLTNNAANDGYPAVSPDGKTIVFSSNRDGNYNLYRMDADGGNQTQITLGASIKQPRSISPDGQKVAFLSSSAGNQEIYVLKVDGTGLVRLTNNATIDNQPVFSPDGLKIAFFSTRDGTGDIYTMDAANGANAARLTTTDLGDQPGGYRPDGVKLAFSSLRDAGVTSEIYTMNADGTGAVRLTNNTVNDSLPQFSPAGNQLVYVSAPGGNLEIYVMNADGTSQTRLTNVADSDTRPAWAVNSAPTARNAGFDLTHDTVLTKPLPVTDDLGAPLTYTRVTSPAHGTLTIDANGVFTYTPAAGYMGPDSFTYRVSDEQGGVSQTATISLRVTETPSLVVNTVSDTGTLYDGLTSLRDAITFANGGPDSGDAKASAITFDAGVFAAPRKTITLTAALPTIYGPGACSITAPAAGVTVSGNNLYRVFFADPTSDLTLRGLNIINGKTAEGGAGCALFSKALIENCTFTGNNAGFDGGALWAVPETRGPVTVNNCTFNNNSAPTGGAILVASGLGASAMTLRNCTITGNSATTQGGGIYSDYGRLFLVNCTVTGNSAPAGKGGGIASFGDATNGTTLSNCIVAGNSGDDVTFTGIEGFSVNSFVSSGYNLIGSGNGAVSFNKTGDSTGLGAAALKLGALANNGGPTPTMALLAGSPALDKGKTTLLTDQRGTTRPFDNASVPNAVGGDGSDIGAYEEGLSSISVSDITITEANSAAGTATFTINLSAPSSQTVTVNAATLDNSAKAGSDYVALPSTTVTFAPGQTSKTVSVTVNGDLVDEADEIFKLRLTGPVNATVADNEANCTILDNDATPQIRVTNASIVEGNSSSVALNIPVTLSSPSSFSVKVDFATADNSAKARVGTTGGDYIARTGTLTFAPGETTKNITVSVIGETIYELNENFFVNLTNPVNGTIGRAQSTGSITNDDAPPTVTISSAALSEGHNGNKRMTFQLQLSAPSEVQCRIQWDTQDMTAIAGGAGGDYVSVVGGAVLFPLNTRTAQLYVSLQGDRAVEADEQFKVKLSNAVNCTIGTPEAIGTIVNDDAAAAAVAEEPSE